MTPDPEFNEHAEHRAHLASYVSQARWFGGKGRDFEVTSVTSYVLGPGVTTNLVGLRYADAGAPATDTYQVPLSAYDQPQDRLAHAAVGFWGGQHHYDAVHDRDAMHLWLRAFAGQRAAVADEAVVFGTVQEHDLDLEAHSTLFSGEQSNSSVAFGEDAILKVFRRVHAGANPDIEIHTVLTRAGNTHVAALYGWAEVASEAGPIHLAMLQQFLRTASDGWELALASVRNLVRQTDLEPEEAGGDFAAEAYRLGANLAEIHTVLASSFAAFPLDSAAVAATMTNRLDAAVDVVPEIAAIRDTLAQRFDAIAEVGGQLAHRVHGDLHLGQTLRTSLGWKLVDFEGEPAKDLAERQEPDSPWRDVAGMIRSFDYAASTIVRDLGGTDTDAGEVAHRAGAWTAHSTAAFLTGYTEQRGAPMSEDEAALLRAYIADKAIYEATYEARNRPGWLPIPLAALAGIAVTAP
ncbi:MAG: hypothetical protein NTV23_13665 [Propionibacteriales bacterium]|nr:hypothetical protein [Propionibacteriales bacterium]